MTDLPRTLSEARKVGSARYFTGKPCKHGHVSPRNTASRVCSTCAAGRAAAKRAYDLEYRPTYAARKRLLRRSRWKNTERDAALKRREDRNYWPTLILPRLRMRAKTKGLEFALTKEDVAVPEICPVLGIPLILGLNGTLGQNPNSPSVDRINNNRGYTPDNVAVISMRANLLKKDATLAELRALVRYMESKS